MSAVNPHAEEWRVVPGYSPYEVSCYGRVRRRGRILLGCIDSDGYKRISTSIEGRRKLVPVHTLVLLAFHGPRPSVKHLAGHGPAGKMVNHRDNLSWVTPQRQYVDRLRDGTDNGGEKNWNAKISQDQADEIRRTYIPRHPKFGRPALCARFGVGRGSIDHIVNRGGWKS